MDNCPKCGAILKVKEGKYSSEINTNKVTFTQLKFCDNKECPNFNLILDIVTHEMN